MEVALFAYDVAVFYIAAYADNILHAGGDVRV
jgi:hypothetical protein